MTPITISVINGKEAKETPPKTSVGVEWPRKFRISPALKNTPKDKELALPKITIYSSTERK